MGKDIRKTGSAGANVTNNIHKHVHAGAVTSDFRSLEDLEIKMQNSQEIKSKRATQDPNSKE